MPKWQSDTVPVGHSDHRRTILDVVQGGVDGEKISQISAFDNLRAGNFIGRHFHKKMSEVYFIFSGQGVMHLRDVEAGDQEQVPVGPRSRVVIPPGVAHELRSETDMVLIIIATDDQSPEDTFRVDTVSTS